MTNKLIDEIKEVVAEVKGLFTKDETSEEHGSPVEVTPVAEVATEVNTNAPKA